MSIPIPLRADFDATRLRRLARDSKEASQARRLLALATIYAGGMRTQAAEVGGVGLQVVRDWVVRFNAEGPTGLIDKKAPGQPPLLKAAHGRRRPDPGGPWRRPLAAGGFGPVDLGGVPDRGLRDDHGPRRERDGLSQALGPASASCAEPRRDGRF